MPYNESIADRIREALAATGLPVEEKEMFRGLCFMLDDKMCACVNREDTLFRIGAEAVAAVVEEPGCRQMMSGGRVMKAFVSVENETLRRPQDLTRWLDRALAFNAVAKASPGRKKKSSV